MQVLFIEIGEELEKSLILKAHHSYVHTLCWFITQLAIILMLI